MYANQDNVLQFASAASKLPPQCLEAEEAILGGIMLDPNAIMRVRDQLKPHHFYIGAHRDIYQAAIRLNALKLPTDILLVTSYLSDNNLLEIIGGRTKIANLLDKCVSAINIDALADLVISKWKRRELGRLGTIAMELQHKSDDEVPLEQAFEELQTHLTNLQLGQDPAYSTSHISEVMIDTYQQIESCNQGLTLPSIPIGFYDLDALMSGGINRGELVILAGRPSMGKSSLAAQIAFNVAQLQNRTVVLFSLEMSKTQIAMRMLCAETNIESGFLKTGRISNSQWQPLAQAVSDISTLPIYLNECATPSLEYFETECRKVMAAEQRELGVVVIDYLQLMDGYSGNRNNEIGAITRGLKRLAMKLSVPVICLSQLSRAVETRPNKRPVLSDLRDSGSIEQDSDKVLMLYRDDYYNLDSLERGICEVIIAKHRDGPTGTIKLLFDNQFTKFKSLARAGW
ncbi:MAG: replicative DNA helicase [Hassallia sp. WJT32-NPBG1]|jgi:replicative DNA helicase|nr:replicative DNA helicase [Hassallia sp. WJT32-NPBG1]